MTVWYLQSMASMVHSIPTTLHKQSPVQIQRSATWCLKKSSVDKHCCFHIATDAYRSFLPHFYTWHCSWEAPV